MEDGQPEDSFVAAGKLVMTGTIFGSILRGLGGLFNKNELLHTSTDKLFFTATYFQTHFSAIWTLGNQ